MSSPPDLTLATPPPARRFSATAGVAGLGSALPQTAVSNADDRREHRRRRRLDRAPHRHPQPPPRRPGRAPHRPGRRRRRAPRSPRRGWTPAAVDIVLVATLSADELTPNAAPQVAHALGAHSAGAMDVGAACTGFVSAVGARRRADRVRPRRQRAVVGAEILSRHLDHADRKTAMLFGDGAGAIVLARAMPTAASAPSCSASDGSAADLILAAARAGSSRWTGTRRSSAPSAALIDATREASRAPA